MQPDAHILEACMQICCCHARMVYQAICPVLHAYAALAFLPYGPHSRPRLLYINNYSHVEFGRLNQKRWCFTEAFAMICSSVGVHAGDAALKTSVHAVDISRPAHACVCGIVYWPSCVSTWLLQCGQSQMPLQSRAPLTAVPCVHTRMCPMF